MDLDDRAVKIVKEATTLSETDLRGALAKMREAEIFIREDAITKLDGVLEFIVVLLRDGKDYQACEMLQGLPDNYIIQDKSGLVGGLVDKIAKVQALVEQARGLFKTDCVGALPILEKAFKLVADYPGLSEDIAALEVAVTQYNSFITYMHHICKGNALCNTYCTYNILIFNSIISLFLLSNNKNYISIFSWGPNFQNVIVSIC